ncbi:glycosyltransferase family 4 protein [Nitratiruptor sp. YY09-18]|uniref:glycosyltransferase family 4 protein n=1 Tax=Nitratiruptor sp. YY09-18 TaxID=2724901 RepID=UPI0019163523|nr:glycosyltransferase family 4 protein [Nitratiruptor sp. YY09-18]BCD67753.1 N,N'-diacetylbacillosaminyl-diphospho-undecaprenol alpha-1,3-N-acetylgalactosaminyltransferase [Nitratiruptor sp. YY09-18]
MRIGFVSHIDWNLYLFRLPIMQRLKNEGWEVYAIAPKGDYLPLFTKEGIKTVHYEIERGSLNPFKELKVIYNLYKAIKPLQLDILHTFTVKPNIYGTFAGYFAKVPHILNLVEGLGSFYIEDSMRVKLVRFMIERLYKAAFSLSVGAVFVNNDDPKYLIQKKIISQEKAHIIKSVGIDTNFFDPLNIDASKLKKELSPSGKPIIMMVGRAIWHKGVKEFYEAAKRLHNEAVFVYVGGTYPDNPSSVSEDFLKQDFVHYAGHQDDIHRWIAACDIFVLPSYREGLPRTLLEAASLAKPLIATDTVGCRDVVKDGYNGFLVPIKDIESLTNKIKLLIEDENLRQKFGKNGRKMVEEEFALEKVVDAYVALYKRALNV